MFPRSAIALVCGLLLSTSPVLAFDMPQDLARLADELHVTRLIEKIQILQKDVGEHGYTTESALELLSLRQRLDYRLTVTSREIDSVLSEIDSEDTRADELRYSLENKRDKALKLNSYANLVGSGGLAVLAGSLGIKNDTVGNIVGTTGGGVNGGLAAYALKEQRDEGVTLHHQGLHPNMLAMIFGFEPEENSKFPDAVWVYLNEKETPEASLTRKDALVRLWESLNRLPSIKTPEGRREASLISGEVTGSHRLTIALLNDRSAMLSDLRAVVSKMNKKLLALMLLTKPEQ